MFSLTILIIFSTIQIKLEKMEIQFKKYSEKAIVPLRATNKSAGHYLFSSTNKLIKSYTHELITTDLILEVPNGFYSRVFGRSGLALKYVITAHNRVIDSDFRGVLCVILFNNSEKNYQVLSGQRIAQIIFSGTKTVKFIEVSQINKTKRDGSGFGSTGVWKETFWMSKIYYKCLNLIMVVLHNGYFYCA